MATVTRKLGRVDHGRPLTLEEFESGNHAEGYRYELIDGRLYVSPVPNLPENQIQEWINDRLKEYARTYPEVIRYVSSAARVFVPGRRHATTLQPDQAVYHDFSLHLPVRDVRWQDVSPILVVDILSSDDPDKDLIRNVELYLQVPSIREYWVLDAREDPDHPPLLVYRRRGRRWQHLIEVSAGETYTTRLLPGFELIVDPHR